CFEVLEAAVWLCLDERPIKTRARIFAQILRAFVKDRRLPEPEDSWGPEEFRPPYPVAIALLTSAEEFVLLHEYGHVANGESGSAIAEVRAVGGELLEVIKRNQDQERSADWW